MPNPSTMSAQLEEVYQTELELSQNLSLPKANREFHLGEARRLAKELGIEGPPPINGRPPNEDKVVFTVHLTDAERRTVLRGLSRAGLFHLREEGLTVPEILDLFDRIEGGE